MAGLLGNVGGTMGGASSGVGNVMANQVAPAMMGGGFQPQGTMPMGAGAVNMSPQNPMQGGGGGGFGDFVRQSGVPLWMGILNAIADPEGALKQTISGYSGYKQNIVAEQQMDKIDNFLLENFKDYDWNDPNIKQEAQQKLIQSGLANSVTARAVLDKYFLRENTIGYFDPTTKKLRVHRKNDDGTITHGEREIPVDLKLLDTSPHVRRLWANTYEGMSDFIIEKAGPLEKKEITAKKFLEEWHDIGLVGMLKKYRSVELFLANARHSLGFTPDISNPKAMMEQFQFQMEEMTRSKMPTGEKNLKTKVLSKEIDRINKLIKGTTTTNKNIQSLPGEPASLPLAKGEKVLVEDNRQIIPRKVNGQVLWFYSDTGEEYVEP